MSPDYFETLNKALRKADICRPVLVIDKQILNRNSERLRKSLPRKMGYRIVAKSLPSTPLLHHIMQRTKTNRLMTFNAAMLTQLLRDIKEAEHLLGKPMPAAAAAQVLNDAKRAQKRAVNSIEWLVDTPERLREYAALAHARGVTFRINLEIDVGLHRGGFMPGAILHDSLKFLQDNKHLTWSGLMGYEAHIAHLPKALGWRRRAFTGACKTFLAARQQATEIFTPADIAQATFNIAGSLTFRLYTDKIYANELSTGSALVKPTDFDHASITDFEPAAFIATPVIKSLPHLRLPGMEYASKKIAGLPRAHSLYIWGGNWKAQPVYPKGLKHSHIVGRSSNQELLLAPTGLHYPVDNYIFFRPAQSEAVFLQFGDIAVYDRGKITDFWPVFPASA